jgi:hypothetical protein
MRKAYAYVKLVADVWLARRALGKSITFREACQVVNRLTN